MAMKCTVLHYFKWHIIAVLTGDDCLVSSSMSQGASPPDAALPGRLVPDPRLVRDLHRGLLVGHPPAHGGVSPQDVLMGDDAPLVTICLVHYNRPTMLLQVCASVTEVNSH